jgi:hypothetical protein
MGEVIPLENGFSGFRERGELHSRVVGKCTDESGVSRKRPFPLLFNRLV